MSIIDIKSPENKGLFENLSEEMKKANPQLGGLEELSAVLALPDEHFNLLAPVFLDELQKSFNNIPDSLVLVQALNASGVKVEDLQASYLDIVDAIEKQTADTFSKPKRDFLKSFMAIIFNTIASTEGIAKKVIEIPIELCHENAKIPTYANLGDAGLDVYALDDITINPGETKLIPTGIKVAIPYGYELQVRPKSGRSLKTKLRVSNTPGTIDSGYRDEIGVIIDNIDPTIRDLKYKFENDQMVVESVEFGRPYTIGKGEKFAQLVLNEIPKAAFYEVDSVSNFGEDRGGGFGSSGLK